MTLTSNHQENTAVESHDYVVEMVSTVHTEETPCVLFRVVNVAALPQPRWQPRTMHAWLT